MLHVKSLRFGANDSDALGCRIPLRCIIVDPLPMSGFLVKNIVRIFRLGSNALRSYPAVASLWISSTLVLQPAGVFGHAQFLA